MGTINMRLFLLALLLVQLSHQAAVLEAAENVSELAFPDGEVEEAREDTGDTTTSGESCVSMIYGGVSYDGCTDMGQSSWCSTSVDSDLNWLTWDYCGYGDANGDSCYFPFYYYGDWYYDCADYGDSLWCATSVYSTYDVYTWKYCQPNAYYWCKCSFEEYEEYYGVASVYADTDEHAWCPCFQYYYDYALETEFSGQEAARSLDRKNHKKKKNAGRSLERKSKKHHH